MASEQDTGSLTFTVDSPSEESTNGSQPDGNESDSSENTTDGSQSDGDENNQSVAGTTEQDSDGDGVPDSEDYAPNDPNVQEKSDIVDDEEEGTFDRTPGFTPIAAVIALISTTIILNRQR